MAPRSTATAAGPSGEDEVEALRSLFAQVPRSLAAKMLAVEQNQSRADEERAESEARAAARQRAASERAAVGHARQLESQARRARTAAVHDGSKQRNVQLVRAVRAEEAGWQEQRESRQAAFEAEMRKRVIEASKLDARLDAQESAAAAAARQEGAKSRRETLQAVEHVRETTLTTKRSKANVVREKSAQGLARSTRTAAVTKKAAGELTRREAEGWSTERERHHEEHRARAESAKAGVRELRLRFERESAPPPPPSPSSPPLPSLSPSGDDDA